MVERIMMKIDIKCEDQMITDKWALYQGDSVELVKKLPDNSIGYSIFSPPFSNLYVYSDSERDIGNSKNYKEFWEHFLFLIKELYRVIKPGRCISVHCSDIPIMKEKDGYIGLFDFPGDIRYNFENCNNEKINGEIIKKQGFILHSKVVIWKDPLIEALRSKSVGLLYNRLCKDSSMSRQGCPDYIYTFKKLGENEEFIEHNPDEGLGEYQGEKKWKPNKTGIEYNHQVWQRYASPVWMDIRQTNTLQYRDAKDEKDEKHICPLQLDVIHRCLLLWTNKGDIVLDPFNGIASTGYKCIELGRFYLGFELKKSYYDKSIRNLKNKNRFENTNIFKK